MLRGGGRAFPCEFTSSTSTLSISVGLPVTGKEAFSENIPPNPATADLSNLLAQGYLPQAGLDGRRLLLVQTPRRFPGGVSFTF